MLTPEMHNEITRNIANYEDFYMPVKLLWKTLVGEGFPIELSILTEALAKDSHFKIMLNDQEELEEEGEDPEEMINEMEAMGYYRGPRVCLADRQPTHEELMKIIQKHISRMNDSLEHACEIQPDDKPETAAQMRTLLEQARELADSVTDSLLDSEDYQD